MRVITITFHDRPERCEVETMIEVVPATDASPRETAMVNTLMPRILAVIYPGAKSLVIGTDKDSVEDIRAKARLQADIATDIEEAGS